MNLLMSLDVIINKLEIWILEIEKIVEDIFMTI